MSNSPEQLMAALQSRLYRTEQERDEYLDLLSACPQGVEGHACCDCPTPAEQRVADLEAAVLALAEKWDWKSTRFDPSMDTSEHRAIDRTYGKAATALRALVTDPAALDRVRREAVEAALAPIEALHFRRPWTAMLDSVTYGQTEFPDQCNCCRVPWPCSTAAAAFAAAEVKDE